MASPVLSRGGFCTQGNGAMQKVDPAYLFENGDAARGVRRLFEGQEKVDAWLALHSARGAIHGCVYQSIYSEHFHGPLLNATGNILRLIDSHIEKLFPPEGEEGEPLSSWDIHSVQTAYTKFETIFISEIQALASYIVTRKGGFDIAAMVDAGNIFFSSDLQFKVPEAIPDLDQAMRCIAFEVPTAAGFHLHRANESVLRVYWDSVTGGAKRPKQSNMGVYLAALDKADKGNKSVRAHLQSIKDFHRNPLMHPEQSLDSVDQAIDLMAAIRCAIGYMLKEIPVPTPHYELAEALIGTSLPPP